MSLAGYLCGINIRKTIKMLLKLYPVLHKNKKFEAKMVERFLDGDHGPYQICMSINGIHKFILVPKINLNM